MEVRTSTRGVIRASEGDWIVKGVTGEYFPLAAVDFEAAYEVAPTGRGEHVTVLPSEFFDTLLDDSPAQPVPELVELFKRHRATPEAE